jgi:hypothetical protein
MFKSRKVASILVILALCLCSSAMAGKLELLSQEGDITYYKTADGQILARHLAIGVLGSAPDYDWWYGCSPTSVGMIMGFYDRNGYGGHCYTNLLPGATAELSNYGNSSALANGMIASTQHINDYWPNPDVGSHTPNCLADFMGTSQNHGSPEPCGYPGLGGTWFWNWTDGHPLTPADAVALGVQTCDGMYGVYEFLTYRGYNYAALYSQYIYGYNGNTLGFSLAQYQAEIDGGRPMVIQVSGHSMFGYGYSGSTVYVHDTWTEGAHTFDWATNYSGLTHYGVMPLTVSGGESCSIWSYCYQDTNYPVTQLQLNIEGNIIRGQAVAPGYSGFPAPITGYIYGGKALFAINYLGDGMRFYQVSMLTGAGTTWGIYNSGAYYDSPHSAQIVGCGVSFEDSEPKTGAPDEASIASAGGDIDPRILSWASCYVGSDFPAEHLEVDINGSIIRGQCTYYNPAAPMTGYIHAGRAFFAIGYTNDNLRFYEVSMATGVGTGWAILGTTSNYYSTRHNVTVSPCPPAAAQNPNGRSGDQD